MKKALLIFSVLFLSLFGINDLNAETEISYSSGIQWVFTGINFSEDYNGKPVYGGVDFPSAENRGEKPFGQTYTIQNAIPSQGDAIQKYYYGPRMLLTRLTGLNVQSNTMYHMRLNLTHDNSMAANQNNINSYIDCGILANGSWVNACASVTAVLSDSHTIDIYFYSNMNGTGVSIQIGNPYVNSRASVWNSFYNWMEDYTMSFGVNSAKLYQTNDNNGILNGITSDIKDTNNKLDDLNNKQDETNDKLDNTNNKLDDLNNSITDETPPDTSEFEDVSGWLPPGPVDSILTLPLNVLNSMSNALNGKCTSIEAPLPFIEKKLEIMCGTEFYSNISGLSLFLNTLFTILGGVMLYKYFVYLYNWIDNIVSLKERDEKWGAV